MNTKNPSGIAFAIRMKLQTTGEKQITTLTGIRRNFLIDKTGKFPRRSKKPNILWRILITKFLTCFLKYGFLSYCELRWTKKHLVIKFERYRSSHRRCSVKKLLAYNFIKKRLWHRCFPVNFAKISRTPFLQSTSGRLLLNIFIH